LSRTLRVEARARKIYCWARGWRRITDFLRGQGALSAIQLGHAGRKVATKPPWEGFEPPYAWWLRRREQVRNSVRPETSRPSLDQRQCGELGVLSPALARDGTQEPII